MEDTESTIYLIQELDGIAFTILPKQLVRSKECKIIGQQDGSILLRFIESEKEVTGYHREANRQDYGK